VLGNLDAKRDWGFSGDYVEAMWGMLQQDKPDDYVIATNEAHTVREFVEETCKVLDIPLELSGKGPKEKGLDGRTGQTIVCINPVFYRPAEVSVLRGDYSKAKNKFGWEPKTRFGELVRLMTEHDFKKESRA